MKKEYKLTIFGDVMCEPPLLAKVKKGGKYDFKSALEPLGSITERSDYVIANLESPLAGESAGYSDTLFSFNTPDSVVGALQNIGVKLVTTSNNHCLDRGIDGMIRTLDALDSYGMAHTGTVRPGESAPYYVFKLGKTAVSIYNATYGTNYGKKQPLLGKKYGPCVNMIREQTAPTMRPPYDPIYYAARDYIKALVSRELGREYIFRDGIGLNRALGLDVSYADDNYDEKDSRAPLKRVAQDAKLAKANSDIALFLPHVGGQFNTRPGKFSEFIVDKALSFGFDGVVAAHSHTTQKAELIDGRPVFWSLGNVTMSPKTEYACLETLPEYGVAAHLYISDKKIARTAFSVYKIVEDEKKMRVVPVDVLYDRLKTGKEKALLLSDVISIVTRLTGEPDVIKSEYEVK